MPEEGLAGALLDAARTALKQERAMRQQVRSEGQITVKDAAPVHLAPSDCGDNHSFAEIGTSRQP